MTKLTIIQMFITVTDMLAEVTVSCPFTLLIGRNPERYNIIYTLYQIKIIFQTVDIFGRNHLAIQILSR